jgi:hypothetical protein
MLAARERAGEQVATGASVAAVGGT